MPGLVMIGPVVWAVGELYTQTHTHTHERYYFIYIDILSLLLLSSLIIIIIIFFYFFIFILLFGATHKENMKRLKPRLVGVPPSDKYPVSE